MMIKDVILHKKIFLFCHPRSGSSHFCRELYRVQNLEEVIHPEILHLPGKAYRTTSVSFENLRKNSNIPNDFQLFKLWSDEQRKNIVKQEFFRLIEIDQPLIIKIFFRKLDSIFTTDELIILKEKYNFLFLKLLRKNLLSSYLSHVISTITEIWTTEKKVSINYDDFFIFPNLVDIEFFNSLNSFFDNFKDDTHNKWNHLINYTFDYDQIHTNNFFKHSILSKTLPFTKINTENNKLIVLKNNQWLMDYFMTKVHEHSIKIDRDFNLLQ